MNYFPCANDPELLEELRKENITVPLHKSDDPMAGKRFDGKDHEEDEIISFGGTCVCGMVEGKIHYHRFVS